MSLTIRELGDMIAQHEARLAKLDSRLDDINAKLTGETPLHEEDHDPEYRGLNPDGESPGLVGADTQDEEPADAGGSGDADGDAL